MAKTAAAIMTHAATGARAARGNDGVTPFTMPSSKSSMVKGFQRTAASISP